MRNGGSLARKSGYQRARKELLAWARSKRRCIPRDELLAVLASMNMSSSSDILSSLQSTQLTQNSGSPNQSLLGVEDLLQAATFNENSSHHHNYHSVAQLNLTPSSGTTIPSVTGSVSNAGAGAVTSLCGHNGHISNGLPRQGIKRPLPPPSPPPNFGYSQEDHSQDQLQPHNMQSLSEFSIAPVSDCFAAAASLANVTDSGLPDSSNNNDNSNNRDVQMDQYFSPVLKKPRT